MRYSSSMSLRNQPERPILFARYLLEENTTIRKTASHFSISKSTVHKDLHEKLPRLNKRLFEQVCALLAQNQAERHLRGGAATKQKYQANKQESKQNS